MPVPQPRPFRTGSGAADPADARPGSPVPVRLVLLPALLAALVACGDDDSPTEPSEEQVDTPAVTSVSPDRGVSGTEVRIDGSNLESGSTVYFGDEPSPRVDLDGGSLFALAPSGLTAGTTYDVRVVNTSGGVEAADTAESIFEAVAPGEIRVNGVTKPRGLHGMTVIIDGFAFGDSLALSEGTVFFEDGNGDPVQAVIDNEADDWFDDFVVTSVPSETADTSAVWVETTLGASDTVEFRILESGQFSPSNIEWNATTPLPRPLQGLGAEFVPVETGDSPANYVFVYGGADSTNTAQPVVYRNTVLQDGQLDGSWVEPNALPEGRAYHATAAATAFTAALDTTTTAAVLYTLGGVDEAGDPVDDVQLARISPDGTLGAWEATTPLPEPLHSADAALFRGYLYLAGGSDGTGASRNHGFRAPIGEDGTLGDWEAIESLPTALAHRAFVSFGPFLYWVGGETAETSPVAASQTGTETAEVHFARVNVRTADVSDEGWMLTSEMSKARSKHSTVFAGGSLFTSSGLYSGDPGSSENTYAELQSDGTLGEWQGATGAETIETELGKSLYNQAMVTFIDDSGNGHLLVLGGADVANEGVPSSDVIYY